MFDRVGRSLWTVVVVAVGLAAMPTLGSAQVPDPSRHLEFRDVFLQTPGPDWQRIDPPPANGKPAPPVLEIGRQIAMHEERIRVVDNWISATLTPGEITSRYFAQQKTFTPNDGKLENLQDGTRTIAGVTYPTLSLRYTPSSGSPVVDQVLLLMFPGDFDQRQRFYEVAWFDLHSATTNADNTSPFDDAIANLTLRPMGTVVASDDFQNPDVGLLANTNPDPDHYLRGYQDGEYDLQKVDPNWDRVPIAQITKVFADTTLAIDTYFASDTAGQYVELGCRRDVSDPGNTGYFLLVAPDRGYRIGRNDAGKVTALVDWRPSPAIQPGGDPMHIEFTCSGPNLSGTVNGSPLSTVNDRTYRDGRLLVGAGSPNGSAVDARFQALVVTQQ
jgi:hypothetical protein